jgi:predicted kinase
VTGTASPNEMHFICPVCEQPTMHAISMARERVIVCDQCDAKTAFELLPPLLFLTGASGSGKSTIYQALVGHVTQAIMIDADLLWSVSPGHDDPSSNYRSFTQLLLHLALRLVRNGRAVMIEGTMTPDRIETLGERHLFSKIAYLALVCDDAELERRLQARPKWRNSATHIPAMLKLNQRLRDHADQWSSDFTVLNTTGKTIQECASYVHDWINHYAR